MRELFPFMRVTIVFVACCIAFIFASNLSGFFVKPSDDPAWKEPYNAQAASAGTSNPDAAKGTGASVFNQKCAACHQANGKGLPGIYPPLVGSELAQHSDVSIPIRIVLHGFQGKIQRAGKEYNGVMTPWKDALSDQEIADVLTTVRSSWGNNASAIDPKDVAEVRVKTLARPGAYTEEELRKPL
ncbi:MAG: cytochrome c [Bacteroidota bacterium]|nr:cytochrome c [Candidatus Kapabacteria bacterium]MDW8220955.1 cytochrome c [Bacteroidota bacterium]